MRDEDFIAAVANRAGLSAEHAATLTRATLETLAERISGGEANDLADQLPDSLGQYLRTSPVREAAERFGVGEFVRRVRERAGADETAAAAAVRAVLSTLPQAVLGGEFEDTAAQLSKEYGELAEPIDAAHADRGRR